MDGETLLKTEKLDDSSMIFSLDVLQTIKDLQMQHGLRHGDFKRYRQFCSRKLRRIRKVVGLPQGTKHKVIPKKLTPENTKEQRCLFIPLISAERAWAYAMDLKSEANTEPRKRFHMINRLKKAVRHANELMTLVQDDQVPSDARTNLEVKAYNSWLNGLLFFELQNWREALENFRKSMIICEKLSEALVGEKKEIYLQRCAEISPTIRYCEYNIGDVSAAEDLQKMRLNIANEDHLTSQLDELIEKTREKESSSLTEVTWLKRKMPIKSMRIRKLILSTKEDMKDIEGEDVDVNRKVALLEGLLKDLIENIMGFKDEYKDDQVFKQIQNKTFLPDKAVPDHIFLYTYLLYLRQATSAERNLLLIQIMKSKDELKKAKPQDYARLYDSIVQNLTEILSCYGLDDKPNFVEAVKNLLNIYKAFKCYYLGQMFSSLKRYKESMALFDKSNKYANQYQVPPSNIDNQLSRIILNEKVREELINETNILKYFMQASAILDSQNSQENKKDILGDNEEDMFQDKSSIKNLDLVPIPPHFETIPCKPVIFDLALSLIDFPSFDSTSSDPTNQSQTGFTGYFKKWIWGSSDNK